MHVLNRISLGIVVIFSILVALASYRFVLMGIEPAFEGLGAAIMDPRLPFVLHVVAAPLALALGGLQVIPRLRNLRPGLHRWMGRSYGLAVLFAGLAGLTMALFSLDRPIAAAGFGLLAILWLWFTAQGIRHARNRDFERHRAMMLRSFALTFGAVTLRIQLPFLMAEGSTYAEVSHIVAWTAWVPNLVVIEAWIRWRAGDGQIGRPSKTPA